MPTADPAHPRLSLVPDWLDLFPPRLKCGKPSFGLSLHPLGVMSGGFSLSFVFCDVFLAGFSSMPASLSYEASLGLQDTGHICIPSQPII